MKPPRLLSLLVVLSLASSTSACYRFDKVQMSQSLRVTTQPPDAFVWTQDASGKQDVGRAPVEVRRTYEVTRQRFNHWHWLWAILSAGATAAGGGLWASDSGGGTGLSGNKTGGIVLVTLGASIFLPALIMCIAGEVQSNKEYIAKQSIMIGASAPGMGDRWASLEIPSPDKEVRISLSPAGEGTPTLLLGRVPAPSAEPATARRPIVAVFGVQDASKNLTADVLEQLTEYLSAQLAATGRYRIVPRDRVRERLADQRKKSYGACYDEACQIELGKALAAQKSLATKLLRVSNRCALTAVLYDLRSETTETAASVDTACSVEALLAAVRSVAQQLARPVR